MKEELEKKLLAIIKKIEIGQPAPENTILLQQIEVLTRLLSVVKSYD